MAGHIYAYGTAQSQPSATASLTEPYFPATMASDPSKYTAAMYLSHADAYTAASRTASHLASLASWSAAAAATDDGSASGIKRTSEALYHQSVNTLGQEAWYTTSALAKRYRYENSSHLPVYPQRPGEKDCAHYMITRTCKFGDTCRFDHPVWVPEGGIPDWKEVLPVTSESLPERPGQLDCPYFLKTQRCKFGLRCKFNHPKETLAVAGGSENGEGSLPERPSETPCAFYLKTGICKFGSTCKFHHPKDVQLPSAGQDIGCITQHDAAKSEALKPGISFVPAMYYNSKELPIRPGEPECPFYLKTFSCKYGATCRYTHPDINTMVPSAAAIGHALVASSPAAAMGLGVVNPVASLYQTIDPRLAQATMPVAPGVYPQRPGQLECDFYMKTGECRFGERCRFHHPYDRTTQSAMLAAQQVKLTLAGLPRREGSINCPYYLKTGTCKYGTTCKFDHPPPGEVMAKIDGKSNDGE